MAGLKNVQHILTQVKNTLEMFAHANRPIDGCRSDTQNVLDFIEQLNRIANIPVQLIDKGHNGSVTKPTHIHQFYGALFHPLGTVDNHQRRIDRRKGAIGILRKIFVTRSIE